jgi:hypothetical protein
VSTATYTHNEVDVDPTTGEPRATHIVPPTVEKTGIEIVMEARVNGTAVEALCGHRFIPERDPKAFPLCSRCREIREALRPDEDPEAIPA